MKKYAFNEISNTQYIFMIYKTQISLAILAMPRHLADGAGTDGWISLTIGWIISILFSITIIRIMSKHPNCTIYDLFKIYFGKWIGTICSLTWILYSIASSAIILFSSIYILQTWIMRNMSSFSLIAFLVIPIYMVARNGLRVIGRFAEFVYFGTFWMPPLLLIGFGDAHFINLLPILKEGWQPVIQAIPAGLAPFVGFEIAFILYPFLKEKQKAYKNIVIANCLSMIINIYITIMSFVYFSPDEIHHILWPAINLMKPLQFPFLERFEIIFLSFYMIVLTMSIISYLYMGVLGTSQFIGQKDHQHHVLVIVTLFAITSYFFQPTYEQFFKIEKFHLFFGILFAFVVPVVLMILFGTIDWIKKRRAINET